jgi:Sulfotransferase domain
MPSKENRAADLAAMNFVPGSWQEVAFEMYAGSFVAFTHVVYFMKQFVEEYLSKPFRKVLGLKLKPKTRSRLRNGKNHTLKVVGVGFGRTGTVSYLADILLLVMTREYPISSNIERNHQYSLALALEELGFPTLHTQHLYENDEIFEMWTNNVFQPSINSGKALLGDPDLDLIVSYGFQATMDLPMALYYEKVLKQYPDCKFILTTRESSLAWFKSWKVMANAIVQPAKVGGYFFTNVNRIFLYLRWLFSVINKDSKYLTFESLPLPDQIEAASIASYEEHNANVRARLPPQKLLEYNVRDGWKPLCQFLDVKSCPSIPFPKTNSARSVQTQAIVSTIAIIGITSFVLLFLVACTFQRITGATFCRWLHLKYLSFLATVSYLKSSNPNNGKNA